MPLKRILSPSQRIKFRSSAKKKSGKRTKASKRSSASKKKSGKRAKASKRSQKSKRSRSTASKKKRSVASKKSKKVNKHLLESYDPYVIKSSRTRRSYLTKDITETMPQRMRKDINLRQYYRLAEKGCHLHQHDPEKCKLDPHCRMSSRGCEFSPIRASK